MKWGLLLAAMLCLAAAACAAAPALRLLAARQRGSLDGVRAAVRDRHPDVPVITPSELADWLGDPGRAPPLLLDVRQPREFAVSRLPGAVRADEADPLAAVASLPRDAPVVAYCSVGWRSAGAARTLRSAGFADVRNLDGSIFLWAIEGRPLENDAGPARRVHPYDASWGRLLPASLRAEVQP